MISLMILILSYFELKYDFNDDIPSPNFPDYILLQVVSDTVT